MGRARTSLTKRVASSREKWPGCQRQRKHQQSHSRMTCKEGATARYGGLALLLVAASVPCLWATRPVPVAPTSSRASLIAYAAPAVSDSSHKAAVAQQPQKPAADTALAAKLILVKVGGSTLTTTLTPF